MLPGRLAEPLATLPPTLPRLQWGEKVVSQILLETWVEFTKLLMVETNLQTYHFPAFSFYFIFTASLLILFYISLYFLYPLHSLPITCILIYSPFGALQSHLFHTTPSHSVSVPMPVTPTPHVYHFSCMAFCPNMKMRAAGSPSTLKNIHEIIQCTTHRTTTFNFLFTSHFRSSCSLSA